MTTNLSKFLDVDESPPTDVNFVFKQEMGGGVKEVKAHKMILAFSSDVFKREFYGSMKSEDVIEIRMRARKCFKWWWSAFTSKNNSGRTLI
jgi:hypothetical protein